jgi:zinc protease
MKKLLNLYVLLVLSTCIVAQNAPTDKIPLNPAVSTGKLANGLTYYIQTNKKPEKKVELRLAVNAGSILETEAQRGLAHFCEHMAFNGTKNFKKNELVNFLGLMGVEFGADLNAYTSFDETVYILPIPTDKPENLGKGFQVLEDWAHNCLYDPAEIDKERGVVLEESRLGKGAFERLFNLYLPKVMAGSRYAERIPIGKDEVIKNASYQTVKSFYSTWYRPNLMAVVVVGDVDAKEALALINKHFGALKNPTNAPKRAVYGVNPIPKTEALVFTDKEFPAKQLSVYFDTQAEMETGDLASYQKSLLNRLFFTMLNGRFSELSQSAKPPFTFAGAGNFKLARSGSNFNLNCSIGDQGIETALNSMMAALLQAQKYGFTEAELERNKKNILARMERMVKEKDKTESSSYADEMVRNFLEKEPAPGVEKELEYQKAYLPKITLADVNKLFSTLKLENNKVIVLSLPEKNDLVVPDQAGLLAMYQKASQQTVKPYEEKALASSMMSKAPSGGSIVEEKKNELLGTTELKLSNGVTVTLKKTDFKNDEIQMSRIRKGGFSSFPIEDKFNGAYVSAIVRDMGIGDFTPTDLRKINTGKIATCTANMGYTANFIRGSSSIKDFETMLQMVYLNATAPRKDEALFEAYKTKQIASLANMQANPGIMFIDSVNKFRYKSPWQMPLLPSKKDYDQVNLNRALEIYRNSIGDASGSHFTFVGNINELTSKALIAQYLGSLPASGKTLPEIDNGSRPTQGMSNLDVYKGNEPQSQININWFAEHPYSDDLALQISILSEVLNFRVIEKMREEMGAIYSGGFGGGMSKRPYSSFNMNLNLPCGPENVEKLIAATEAQIKDLMEKGPTEEEMTKVKQQRLEKNRESMKENATWLSQLERINFYQDDADRFLNEMKYVNALTADNIKQAAKIVFGGPNRFKGVLYPEKK